MILEHLNQARRHVAEGEQRISRQKELIGELRRGGHSTEDAENFLRTLEGLQVSHVQGRDRVEAELAALERG